MPTPKDAATVILIRDAAPGVEAFLLTRVAGMAFAGGMTVFPGGGVDPRDADPTLSWVGRPPGWWAQRFGIARERAVALVCAAARETFEECGVLLAGRTPDTIVTDTSGYREARAQLVDKTLSFSEFLARAGLILRADLMAPWANWITPVGEGRRYDTRFFVAALPEGQQADGATTEAQTTGWHTAGEAIAQWRAGERMLLPPTWSELRAIGSYRSSAEILAAERAITPIQPVLTRAGKDLRIDFDGWHEYSTQGPLPGLG